MYISMYIVYMSVDKDFFIIGVDLFLYILYYIQGYILPLNELHTKSKFPITDKHRPIRIRNTNYFTVKLT